MEREADGEIYFKIYFTIYVQLNQEKRHPFYDLKQVYLLVHLILTVQYILESHIFKIMDVPIQSMKPTQNQKLHIIFAIQYFLSICFTF